jgi:hypothetical protein
MKTPPGWKLVPKEPTDAMIEAGDAACQRECRHGGLEQDHVYRAMLAEAPCSPDCDASADWRAPLLEIQRLLSAAANDGKPAAVKESNANQAWHVAERALTSGEQT